MCDVFMHCPLSTRSLIDIYICASADCELQFPWGENEKMFNIVKQK